MQVEAKLLETCSLSLLGSSNTRLAITLEAVRMNHLPAVASLPLLFFLELKIAQMESNLHLGIPPST